jgi:hypothetical protein
MATYLRCATHQFCADFLSGKLRSAEDAREAAKKALLSSKPINRKNTAVRKARKRPPEEVRGISEQYKPSDHIVTVRMVTSTETC